MAYPIPSIGMAVELPPTSTDEVINLTLALELFQADVFRKFAMSGIQSAKPILDQYAKISELAALVRTRVLENFTPISITRLDQISKTEVTLKDFFNKDGPVLGENLVDAMSTVTELTKGGVYINFRHEIPVLTEIDNKDGKTIIRTLSWFSVDALGNISNFPKTLNTEYPGSVTHSNLTKDMAGKVTSETRYTVFVDYANLRTTLDNLSGSTAQLQEMLLEAGTQISFELNFIKKASDEADKKQELSEVFTRDQLKIAEKIDIAIFEISNAAFKLEQILIRERQFLKAKISGQIEARIQAENKSQSVKKIPLSQFENDAELDFFDDRDEYKPDLLAISSEFKKNKIENNKLIEDISLPKNDYSLIDDPQLLIEKSDPRLHDKAMSPNYLIEDDDYARKEKSNINGV